MPENLNAMKISHTVEYGWEQITGLTSNMLMHAQAGEWEQVIQMETDRQKLIQQFFNQNSVESFASEIATGISHVMATDREIMQLGKNGLRQMSNHLQDISTGKQATDAYKCFS